MAKGWYVLQVYTGYENKVEKFIRLKMEDGTISEYVFDIKVPAEDVVEIKDGKKKTTSRKILPGYILLEMDLPDRGWKIPCNEIRRIDGVTGFVGTLAGSKPQPISNEEAKAILQQAGELKSERRYQVRQEFVLGEELRIVDGPFETFTGVVEEINQEKGKLRVMVGIFGRNTPVEVAFNQVERL